MSKRPFYTWYMPDLFEVFENDCQLLDDVQRTIRREILVAYWRANCELEYKLLGKILRRNSADIRTVFNLCPGLEIVDGRVHHQRYKDEFLRMLKRSKGARAAALKRWDERGDAENAE